MEDIAGWIAPIATMIAAMMTAANLGARVTGWGFVVFTVGSLGWVTIAVGSGQTNLLATNAFLTFVNLVGIWRWLGRQSKYEVGSAKAADRSAAAPVPTLLPVGKIAGAKIVSNSGEKIGEAVEAMIACDSGRVSYVVVSTGGVGGVGETLHALPRDALTLREDAIVSHLTRAEIDALPSVDRDNWPKSLRS